MGGSGWQEYDRTFQRQVAIDPHLPWHSLHPGLQAATVLSGRGAAGGMFCSVCCEVDHSSAQCALAVVQQWVFKPAGAQGQRSRRSENICASSNRRSCAFLGTCVFRHVCSICLGDHKVISCPSADRLWGSHLHPVHRTGCLFICYYYYCHYYYYYDDFAFCVSHFHNDLI